jgi:hypothetical protein
MAMEDLKRMTGNKNIARLDVFHNPLCERTGGGLNGGWAKFRTKADVWASAGISGPVLCCSVRSPTIFEVVVATISAGGPGIAVAGEGRHRRGTIWKASRAALPPKKNCQLPPRVSMQRLCQSSTSFSAFGSQSDRLDVHGGDYYYTSCCEHSDRKSRLCCDA